MRSSGSQPNLQPTLVAPGLRPIQTAPTTNPAIRGGITSRTAGPSGDLAGSILVEGQVEADTTFDTASDIVILEE